LSGREFSTRSQYGHRRHNRDHLSHFLWQYINCTPLAAAIMGVDEARRAALERDVVEGWKPWTSDESGMRYRQDMLVASGRR
jgi:hypothetical protein